LEEALRAAYTAEKGFRIRASRAKDSWEIHANKGLCSGFDVRCTPIPKAGSFGPTLVSVRVTFGSPIFLLSSYLLVPLYLSLIALGWVAPLLGWGQFPGPGFLAFAGAVGVIVCAMIGGVAVGIYARATGQYSRLVAQLDAIRELVRSTLGADEPALRHEKVRSDRFRRVLGWLLVGFGLLWLGLGCVWLWELKDRTGVLVLGACILLGAVCFFLLAYGCLRKPATESSPIKPVEPAGPAIRESEICSSSSQPGG
jgi:hypothetical protein